MKKVGVLAVLLVVAFLCVPLLLAQEENATNETTTENATTPVATQQQDTSKTKDGFMCLEEKVGDCSGLSVQEIALTIMATPDDDVFDDCVRALKDKKSSDNWGNIRDTALAILALDHAGEDTEPSEKWLLEKTRTPTDLTWYVEQDSNGETECRIGYDSQDYTIFVGENKKIDRNAGSCLSRAQSNFWLEVNSECLEKDYIIECDSDFIATLLYKNKGSSTIYVLEGTESSPAYGSVTLSVNSKCFGMSSCEYEGTVWAALALLKTGHDIEAYIPYIVALSDTNEQYLPSAFVYMVTNYEDYASQLISEIKLGNYWLATKSAYNKYYDTSLAIISLGTSSTSEQVVKAKDWLLFSQGENGCWQNSIRETAIVLWALEGRSGRAHGGTGGGVTYCSEAGYFCIPSTDCPASEDVGNNYFCSSLSETCCTTQNLRSCSAMGGQVCSGDTICTGNERRATDTDYCCTGECVERPQESECEQMFYTCMDNTCSDNQEPVAGYACNVGQICCRAKIEDTSSSKSLWWLWLLIALVIIGLGVVGWLYRENIKAWWNKIRKKKGDQDPKGRPGRPGGMPPPRRPGGMPPRPGFPPVRRRLAPPMKQKSTSSSAPKEKLRSYDRRDPHMSDTFKKLRDLSDK